MNEYPPFKKKKQNKTKQNKILFHERKIQNINAHVAYVKLKIIIARHDEIIIYY